MGLFVIVILPSIVAAVAQHSTFNVPELANEPYCCCWRCIYAWHINNNKKHTHTRSHSWKVKNK